MTETDSNRPTPADGAAYSTGTAESSRLLRGLPLDPAPVERLLSEGRTRRSRRRRGFLSAAAVGAVIAALAPSAFTGGETDGAGVASASATTFGLRVAAALSDGPQPTYFEGGLTQVTVAAAAEPTEVLDPYQPSRPPWQRSWLDLKPGRYIIIGAIRACDGNCGALNGPTDSCQQTVDLTEDTLVRVVFTFGAPCTITVAPDPTAADHPPVRDLVLMDSGWQPGDGGRRALVEGTVRVNPEGCVYVEGPGGTVAYIAWPSGWTGTIDRALHVVLRDPTGQVEVRDGDHVSAAGGYVGYTGARGGCRVGGSFVFSIQSDVNVTAAG